MEGGTMHHLPRARAHMRSRKIMKYHAGIDRDWLRSEFSHTEHR